MIAEDIGNAIKLAERRISVDFPGRVHQLSHQCFPVHIPKRFPKELFTVGKGFFAFFLKNREVHTGRNRIGTVMVMLNVNAGHNPELMEMSKTLREFLEKNRAEAERERLRAELREVN